ncbi:Gfo/Idh/MocA family oxidoreductase [Pararhizobium sp. YC-54]|uniref:Gfo/Idh/MocA family protein n=1 Tax=Pararhizobium sp. YC-54 TaxID=2986920 RepID=UPI0021F6C876|nr:Gfo/Idh/MocA family oxidoreductase [Pararhizobium sp. YC-54]MCW0001633.1 Gfo/Idh/MocA family oxidoreductase [Pararhizobium sp. YC-54]
MNATVKEPSPKTPLNWAVLGTGSIATAFAEDIRLTDNAKLVAVCSRTLEAATAFSNRFGGLRVIPTIDALAGDPLIDAVYLATPNTAHFDQARMLLSAGKPVLIEKPLVTTAVQAQALAELAEQRPTFAMEGLWTAFLPAIGQVRQLLAGKAIGAITGIRAELAYERTFDGNNRFFSKGGGSLLDLGVYPIALALALFGSPRTGTGRWSAAPTGVDMSADITLGYDGFQAKLSCGFDRNGANRFIIEGETGCLVIDSPFLRASRVILTRNRIVHHLAVPSGSSRLSRIAGKVAGRLPLPGLTVYRHDFPGNGLQFEIAAASQAILEGQHRQSRMPLRASAEALGIIESIRALPPS